ncbi:hypothetical protein MYCTH_2305618 [Thermothelomyces thermophilus ATCC 42464]|uniref:FAD-binding domain-containing protein n=1 Tax=Thermothelomyces thermophilus (strain ATCC 42464 / BCRC 31852 / DSM 1799) TaxID=573729 RepID=G2QDP0_THET4|nr:uncharacterized protein MYCTH_2305618 [Thermothelomyces thermophilus ATCC 42464]AEO58351.1 hypothetical protein MYCTH_2305618 [Thermothelomyces thermophilus ATCC 42464]
MYSPTRQEPLHVAIIGAGIAGVSVALGLQARGVSYTIYERAPGFREIGAGIGFSPNAEHAMRSLNPDMFAAYRRVANPNGEDYFQWVDGYETNELIFKLHVGKDSFLGGLRSTFLDEWSQLIPSSAVQFDKHLDTITKPAPDSPSDKLLIHFTDGTTAAADAIVGCDGIRSRVRQLILPEPPVRPGYTQKFCFRALAPMPAAVAALGYARTSTRFMYNGPGAHLITYPVANSSLLNILAVLSDPSPSWPHPHHTAAGSKSEVTAAFAEWCGAARAIVGLLPDSDGGKMDKWGIFDLAADPVPQYHGGRVCVAGDAAHATGPHLGAGAGMGIEDALVLGALLAEANKRWTGVEKDSDGKGRLVEKALEVYNDVRYLRTQEVIHSTRKACDLFHWRDPDVARDPEGFGKEITELFYEIWKYDVDGMVERAVAKFVETAL